MKIITDDYGAVLLHLDGGARGTFHVTRCTPAARTGSTSRSAATEGSMVWDSESPEYLWMGRRGGPNSLHEPRPGPALARGRRGQPLPRRPRRRLPRRLQAARPGVLQLHRLGLHRHAQLPRPSPTATARSASARPSPKSAKEKAWVASRLTDRLIRANARAGGVSLADLAGPVWANPGFRTRVCRRSPSLAQSRLLVIFWSSRRISRYSQTSVTIRPKAPYHSMYLGAWTAGRFLDEVEVEQQVERRQADHEQAEADAQRVALEDRAGMLDAEEAQQHRDQK